VTIPSKWLRAASVALIVGALAGCTAAATPSPQPTTAPSAAASSAASVTPSKAPLVKVKYGLPVSTVTLDTSGIFFAIDKGFMAEQGLEVEVTGYARATAIRAMLSGGADIIEIDSGSALLAYVNGAPLKFISMPIPGALDVIVAKSDIKSVEQAVGKKWATSGAGSQGQVFAEAILKNHNIALDKVTFVPVGSSADRAKALLAGTVDLTTMTIATTPAILDEVTKGTLVVIGTIAKEIPSYLNVFDAVGDLFMAQKPEIVQKFITAEMKGYRWAAQNQEEAADIATKHIPETARPLVLAGIKRMVAEKIYNFNSFTVDQVTQAIKFLTDSKLVTGTIAAKDVTETKFADEAAKALGSFTAP
jgi:ABC-type nitrate/sulfonate/bicarbonate transport system substrate-binding protein